MRKIARKGQGLASEKTIIYLIAALVLLLFILFLARGNIINFIRGLPGFIPGDGDNIDDIADDPVVFEKVCSADKIVGKVEDGEVMGFVWKDGQGLFNDKGKRIGIIKLNKLIITESGQGVDSLNEALLVRKGGVLYFCRE